MKSFCNELKDILPDSPNLPNELEFKASVGIVLHSASEASQAKVLFIKRTENKSDPWSGHIAFPGGRNEPDENLHQTAERETHEEVGIDLRKESFLGALDPHTPKGKVRKKKLHIFPYVFYLENEYKFDLDQTEVAEAFWVPLNEMFNPENFRYSKFHIYKIPMKLPSFIYNGHVIWGVTYVIMVELLKFISQTNHGKIVLNGQDPEKIWPLKPY